MFLHHNIGIYAYMIDVVSLLGLMVQGEAEGHLEKALLGIIKGF